MNYTARDMTDACLVGFLLGIAFSVSCWFAGQLLARLVVYVERWNRLRITKGAAPEAPSGSSEGRRP